MGTGAAHTQCIDTGRILPRPNVGMGTHAHTFFGIRII